MTGVGSYFSFKLNTHRSNQAVYIAPTSIISVSKLTENPTLALANNIASPVNPTGSFSYANDVSESRAKCATYREEMYFRRALRAAGLTGLGMKCRPAWRALRFT